MAKWQMQLEELQSDFSPEEWIIGQIVCNLNTTTTTTMGFNENNFAMNYVIYILW